MTAPYGRIAKAQDSYTHRLGWKLLRGPIPEERTGSCIIAVASTPRASERYVRRLGWKLLHGSIPNGIELHHRCGVHTCWNLDHLMIVTHAENMAFRRNTVKSHCRRGHARWPERPADLSGV
jgi:hypothetical protein